jgi:acetyl-CoA carboxylase biotin carboxyl carrier protein
MDFEFIEKVVRLVEEADIGELELESPEGLYLVVKKTPTGVYTSSAPFAYPQMMHGVPAPAPMPAAGQPAVEAVEEDASIEIIKAPMVGTFYRAPAPDAPPFIEVGQSIRNETIVCILEAMKVMNEIKSGISGVVSEIMVENGQPVEFGQPLFKVKK